MAQVPATQQPQPVPSHGMFFVGACFPPLAGIPGIDIPGIIMAQGMEAALAGLAIKGAEPLRTNPRATSNGTIRRLKMLSIKPHDKRVLDGIQSGDIQMGNDRVLTK